MQLKTAAAFLVLGANVVRALLLDSRKPNEEPSNSSAVSKARPSAADVATLHHKLEAVAHGLDSMLNTKSGLAATPVAPSLRTFLKELHVTLAATEAPKNATAAMTRLRAAQAGIASLTKDLNSQQESLMHQDAAEQTNLLLGVLMTRRAEPMDKQLEVLRSADFQGLPVSKALIAKHDGKVPLFQQAAAYADAHGMTPNMTAADAKAQRLAQTTSYFEQRVEKMESEEKGMQERHSKVAEDFHALIKSARTNESAHKYELMLKQSDRKFKKQFLTHQQQTRMMKDVASSLRHGDAKALEKARNALQSYMDRKQARKGDFLYLIQLGHQLERRDCPFCVAQCIGKCHDGGKPYAQCMTQCAEAGQ